jgi:pimeloyl-ACP methyl ester carboxylesterase
VPDTAFLAELVRSLRAEFVLDSRVPTIMGGISNGAMEAAQVACKYPGLLDGVFLDAGNLQDPSCATVRPRHLLLTRGVRDRNVPIGGLAYSDYLRTRLLPDQVLIDAFRRGSTCSVTAQFLRSGIRSRSERCGDRNLRVIRDQAAHDRDNNYRPGIMNRVALSVEFINGVIRETRARQ